LTVEIRYWDRGAWTSYLKNDILPFYESLLAVLNLWKKLKEIAHGKLLSDVIKDAPSLELAFAAGTSPPDKYEEGGLAQVYKSLLGAYIRLREYYFLKSHGRELKTICTVSKTEVVDYIDHMSVLLERVLTRACELGLITQADVQSIQESSGRAVQEVLAKPENISEKFVEFLNKALRLTVAYNEHTRLIWHLRKIPKKYMKEFYPELLKPDVFKFIQELLGLNEYIVPQVEDPEIVDMYTIFSFDYAIRTTEPTRAGYAMIDGMSGINVGEYFSGRPTPMYEPYGTIGGCLCRINELIWGLFRNYPSRDRLRLVISGEVPDPFSEWQRVAVSEPPTRSRLDPLNNYENLSILDENLPAIFMGIAELVKGEGGELYIFGR
jgi:hypothetical protein